MNDSWLLPTKEVEALWGIPGGLAVGLWPQPGPRGLLRIYTPYLGHPAGRMVNFISIEPIAHGRRGQSELEVGLASGKPGLTFTAHDLKTTEQTLTLTITPEPFRNGAKPRLTLTLDKLRPHELALTVHADEGSAPLEACILSATMGNYMRLRQLRLKKETVVAKTLWPSFTPDPLGFAPWRVFPADQLVRQGDDVLLEATPSEPDPSKAEYAPTIPPHWRYQGKPAVQYWRTAYHPQLRAQVNGRDTYWGGHGAIPGGVSFENVEIQAPFQDGQTFVFGVRPR